jgi:choline dehydrogenase-like flavoprotein
LEFASHSNCRAHDIDNLYVTDGSFMPTGGSVHYTWTIYANAFRVADKILSDRGEILQSNKTKSPATFLQ